MDPVEEMQLRPFKRNFFKLGSGKTRMPLRGAFI
jgi:hypothetical protein